MPSIKLDAVTLSLAQRNIARSSLGARESKGLKTRVNALNRINLELKPEDRVALIGGNGAGKTSLLRLLGGVIHPTAGSVIIEGTPVCLFSIQLGMQPELSGRENIFLRGTLLGKKWGEIRERLDEIVDFAELAAVIDQPLYAYSRGMAMRLAFSVSTAFQPDILLLDEWIGAGDEDFQKKVRQRMEDLVQNSAITVVASHNRRLLKEVCNKGLWLCEGQVAGSGCIDDVLHSYAATLANR